MKYTMKKTIAFLLTLVMLVNILPVSVLADQPAEGRRGPLNAPATRGADGNTEDFDVEVSFHDYDDNPIAAPSVTGNYYLIVMDTSDFSAGTVANSPNNTYWSIVNLGNRAGTQTPFTVHIPGLSNQEYQAYSDDQHNPIGLAYSDLPDEVKSNLKVRLVHTTEELPHIGKLKDIARNQTEKYNTIMNQSFTGYDPLGTNGPVSDGAVDYRTGFKQGNTKELDVVIEFDPTGNTTAIESGVYYVVLEATSADGNSKYYKTINLTTDGSAKTIINVEDGWSDGQNYSPNWQGITAKVITAKPNAGGISAGPNKPTEDKYYDVDYIKSYKYTYQYTQETDDEQHILHMEHKFILSYYPLENALNPMWVLGPGVNYGVTAQTFNQTGHMQTNFATNYYICHGGDDVNVQPDLGGNATGSVVAGHIDGVMHMNAPNTGDVVLFIDKEDESKILNKKSNVIVVESSAEKIAQSIVNPILNHGQAMSDILRQKEATYKPTSQGFDLTVFEDGKTIYIDPSEIDFKLDGSPLKIHLHKNQTIVFNELGTDVHIGKIEYTYSDGTNADTDDGKEWLSSHVVFNMPNATSVELNEAIGMFLIPQGTSKTTITTSSEGWIISGGEVTSGNQQNEWHCRNKSLTLAVDADTQFGKKVNNVSPAASEVFEFDLYQWDENEANDTSDVHWTKVATLTNSGPSMAYSVLYNNGQGGRVFKIKEKGKASTTKGTYICDTEEYYITIVYMGASGVVYAAFPEYYDNVEYAIAKFRSNDISGTPESSEFKGIVDATEDENAISAITFNNTRQPDNITVNKAWAYTTENSAIATESRITLANGTQWPTGTTVTIQLQKQVGEGEIVDVEGKSAILSADQPSYTFTGLVQYEGDDEITYSVKETKIEGTYAEHFELEKTEQKNDGSFLITNKEKTAELTLTKSVTVNNGTLADMDIQFVVKDEDGETVTTVTMKYPSEFTDGSKSVRLTQADGILPGETYTVIETATSAQQAGYTRTTTVTVGETATPFTGIDNPSGTVVINEDTNLGSIEFGNAYILETVDIEVDKAWLNADGSKTWPNGVTVGIQLTADGSDVTGKTATLSADQTSYKFTSLPKYKADGTTAIAYSVKEAEVPGYDSDVGTLTNGKITVTNTQETVEVEVDKAWLNADGSKTWPNGVTVGIQLTADGSDVTGKTATLSADQTSYKFTSLPKYKADGTTAIAYSVKEAEVPGYDSDVGTLTNGKITVTNTQETVEVEVDKAWLNADGSKTWPNGVTVGIQLTADGSDVTGKTATLSADQTSYKFTSLPKYKADGTTAIAYSVKEAEVPGYDSDVGTLTNGKITVTNTQETVEVEVDKAWLNADGSKTWPNGVTVGIQLTADGSDVTGKTATLSADQTSYKFTSLPKYKADGTTEIAYSVKEAEVPGYDSDVGTLTNGKITVTNTQETVEVEVDKAWLNADGSKTWPNGVTVGIQLTADGSDVTGKTATLSADQTSYKFTSLPKYKADGTTAIAYSVKEAEVPGYDSDVGTLTNGKITVTNTQETVEVEVDKAWLNADGSKTWPNGVTVGIQLTADGSDVTGKTATLSADQTSYKFTSLPKYKADGTTAIAYSVKEAEVPGYGSEVSDLTNGKITITNKQGTVDISVDKAWLNADGSKTWPNGVTVGIQLTADGSDVTGKTATLSADQTSYKFTSLPKYKADGTTAIAYSVKEAEVPGYDSDVGTLTNGKITVTNTQETVEVEVDKAWLNADGSKTWPNGVTVGIQLTADGSDVTGKTATLSADQTSYKFTSLPKYKADGTTAIAYSVKEAEVPGYDSDVGTLTNGKITVTNTQETVEVEVDKAWLNADGSKTWPNGVTVGIQLTADGSDVTGKTATLSADQTSYKFTSLPKYKADGTTEIAYSVKEAEVPGYDSDVGTLTNGKITVTNTQETLEVEVDKAWLNADGSKTWPNGVTVGIQLTADGSDVTGKTATLSADQTSYKFTSLPKYKADGTTEIAYSVKEAEVPGYDSDVGTLTNGKITVTNTQETVEVEVDKAWLNADGSKTWPNGVTVGIQLTADGSDVTGKTATLSADQTSYKFTSLPKYKADGTTAIAYSVKEAEVPGYDSDVGTLTNGKITVTNTQETVEVEVDKAWLNADGSKTWPNGVTVGIQLTADGSDVTDKTATLSADQTSYKFTSLPKYKADGTTAIAYSVKEAEVPGYDSDVGTLANGKITVTNTQETVEVEVDKAWLNADGSKTWPNGVTVGIQLTADGSDVTGKTATLSADQTSYKFTSLPKYKADGTTAIAYSVKEAEVPGYDSDVGTLTNGKITVTNTQETVEVEVDKAWLNADGSKTWPNGVTVGIQLTADGSDVTGKTATLSADQTSYKFTSLPKYKADGTTAIAYSVKEAEVPGYGSEVSDLTNGKITITNKQGTVDISVDKAWLNADGSKTWPNGVTVGIQLMADGSDVTDKTATLSADQTSYKFTSLPKYKADGTTEIAYSVKEAEVPGYDSDVGTLTNGKITVTNTQETVEVEVDKAWLNADGSKTWPNGVTVGIQLTADGSDVTGKTATLSADQTSYKFTSLPKYKADGTTAIAYSVKEAEVPGYDSDVGTLTNGKITVTNTQETVEVEVDKAWLNADGSKTWPNGVTVGIQLTADGSDVTGKTATLSADQTSYKFTSLPKYKADGTTAIAYSVKEAEVPGYDSDVGTLTNGKITVTNTQETVEVEVDKAWLNADGSKTWPNGVTVGIQLTADGSDVTGKTATLSADQTSYKFTSLPKYKADGTTEIAYSVKEAEVPGYDSDVGTLTNGKITVTNTQETVEVEVDKAWLNADGSKTWPNGVTVGIQLTADGSDVTGKTATLSADQTSYKFTSLPKYKADGTTEIAYSVKEAEVPGYDSDVGTLTNGKITVTNTQETVEVEVDKAWLNADGSKTWPNGVTVGIQLTADGSDVTGKTATLSADQTSYKFTSLPKYKADGTTEIAYSVKEAEVPGYDSDVGTLTNGKITVTNTQETVEVEVDKAWLNADGSKTWPNGVTVGIQLTADGSDVTGKTATLSADQTSYKFTSLPKYKADGTTAIAYSVKEAEVPGYDSDVGTLTNGKITVTNTQETVEVEVDKAWLNADGSKTWPNGVTVGIQLTADGSDVTGKTATLSADQTSYKFTSLPKYKADGTTEIAYSVKEAEVPGYDSDVGTLTNGKITVTNTQETVEVEVDKAWLNADGSKTWPNGVTVGIQLTADGSDVTGKTATLSADQTSYKFTSLPKYKADGTTAIAYSVKELDVAGYTSSIGALENGKITVTNTQKTGDLTVSKTLVSDAAVDADQVFEFTVVLSDTTINGTYGDMTFVDGVATVELKDGETVTASGLPIDIEFSVKEEEYEQFTTEAEGASGIIIENEECIADFTNTRKVGDLEVSKTVKSSVSTDADKKFEFTVTLSDTTINKTYGDMTFINGVATFELKDGETATATGLPTDIEYTVEEAESTDYTVTSTNSEGTITVEGCAAEFVNARILTSVAVKKLWKDENNSDGLRPTGLKIELLADGELTGKSVNLNADNNWVGQIDQLPKRKDGKEIVYTWKEPNVVGYTLTGTSTSGSLTTLTNTHEAEKTKVEVKKVWVDSGEHPADVEVQLYADGKALGDAVKLNAGNGWKFSWNNLCRNVRDDGVVREIKYTVAETKIPEGYVAKITGNASTGFVITNTKETGKLVIEKEFDIQIPEEEPEEEVMTTDIEIVKIWDDNNNKDGNRPKSITVHLYAGGEEVRSAKLTAANGWKHTFGELPKFVNGHPITYTVKEDPVRWYVAEIHGYTIRNKYQPEMTSVSVRKVWDDENNKHMFRPTSVHMTLSNGMSVILNEENGWMASITGLPTMVNGKPAEYTWTEQEVIGYELESMETEGTVTTFTNKPWSRPDKPTEGKTPRLPGEEIIIEEYETPLGVDVIINHVGDCFD